MKIYKDKKRNKRGNDRRILLGRSFEQVLNRRRYYRRNQPDIYARAHETGTECRREKESYSKIEWDNSRNEMHIERCRGENRATGKLNALMHVERLLGTHPTIQKNDISLSSQRFRLKLKLATTNR